MMSCAPFHSIPLDVLIDIRFYLNLDVKEREVKIYHLQIRAETMPRLFTTLALFMKFRENIDETSHRISSTRDSLHLYSRLLSAGDGDGESE